MKGGKTHASTYIKTFIGFLLLKSCFFEHFLGRKSTNVFVSKAYIETNGSSFYCIGHYNHSLSGMNRHLIDTRTESICILVESNQKIKIKTSQNLIYFHSGLRFYPHSRTYTGFHTWDIPPPSLDFRPNLFQIATTFPGPQK